MFVRLFVCLFISLIKVKFIVFENQCNPDEILVELRTKPPEVSAPSLEISGSSTTYFSQLKTLLNSQLHSDVTFRLLGNRDGGVPISSISSLLGSERDGESCHNNDNSAEDSSFIHRISHEHAIERDILTTDVSLLAATDTDR